MTQNGEKTSPYGIERVTQNSGNHKNALGQIFQLPASKVNQNDYPSFKLDLQGHQNSLLYCQKITPRKSSHRTVMDSSLHTRTSTSPESNSRRESVLRRGENEKVIIVRKHSSRGTNRTFNPVKVNHTSILELNNTKPNDFIKTKNINSPTKTDSNLNKTVENWKDIIEKPRSPPRTQTTGVQHNQRVYTNPDDKISLLYEFLGEMKDPYNPIKPKNSLVDASGSYHFTNSYLYGKKEASEEHSYQELKPQTGLASFRPSFNNIGIHLIKRTSYTAQRSSRAPKAESALISQRSVKSIKHYESFKQDSIQNKEENEMVITEEKTEAKAEAKGGNTKFNELFNLMKGIANRKAWKHASTDYSKKKNYVPYSKMKNRIHKIKHKTHILIEDEDTSKTQEKFAINKLKICPAKGFSPHTNNPKKKEEKAEHLTKDLSPKIRIGKTRKAEIKMKELSNTTIEETYLL